MTDSTNLKRNVGYVVTSSDLSHKKSSVVINMQSMSSSLLPYLPNRNLLSLDHAYFYDESSGSGNHGIRSYDRVVVRFRSKAAGRNRMSFCLEERRRKGFKTRISHLNDE
jgi:hypothetical protein